MDDADRKTRRSVRSAPAMTQAKSSSIPTWRELWQQGGEQLAAADNGDNGAIESPRLDASLLLSAAGGMDRTALFSRFPDPVPEEVAEQFSRFLQRRLSGEPVAYITGHKEFWGLDFLVGPQVLTPRPDTETLVEALLEALFPQEQEDVLPEAPLPILDLCCGSGCIGISLAHELLERGFPVDLTLADLSSEALKIAQSNVKRLLPEDPMLQVRIQQSDLFDTLPKEMLFRFIASNPPYLTEEEVDEMVQRGWKEPELALRGGSDGLELIRKILDQGFFHLHPGGYLFIESASSQSPAISRMLLKRGYEDVQIRKDLAGRDRITLGRKPRGDGGTCLTASRSSAPN